MLLTQLELRNWCQHAHRVVDFGPGANVILGHNGSGKSNLMGAVSWLLTGANPNAGVKEDNIHQHAPDDQRANASLTFSHQGHAYRVVRHLRPESTKATLHRDGEEKPVAAGENPVNQYLAQLLIDGKMFNRFVFIGQKDMRGFLEDKKAELDLFFQRLFDTSKADKCQEAVRLHMQTVQVPDVAVQLDAARQAIQQLLPQLAAVDQQLAPLPPLDSYLAEQRTAQATVQEGEVQQARTKAILELQTLLQDLRAQFAPLNAAHQQLLADIATLQEAVTTGQTNTQAAMQAMAAWEHYRAAELARQQHQRNLEYVNQQLAALVAPTPPPPATVTQALAEAARQLRGDLHREIQETERLLQQFRNTGVAECPTCHTPTANIETVLQEREAKLPALRAQLTECFDAVNLFEAEQATFRAYEAAERAYTAQREGLTTKQEGLQGLLQTAAAQPTQPEAEAQGVIRTAQECATGLASLQARLPASQAQVSQLAAMIEARAARLAELEHEQQLTGRLVSPEQCLAAQQRIEQIGTQFRYRQGLEQTQAALRQQLAGQQALEADLVRQQNEGAVRREWLAQAAEVRAVLKALPSFVAQQNLVRLQSAVNAMLQAFQADFRVTAQAGLSFLAHFPDGTKTPALRLSIGQQVTLSWAFWSALNATFAPELGFLALDEPTAYLDKQRIRAVAHVLERLRAVSASRGLQFVIITHEDELAPLFDTVIRL